MKIIITKKSSNAYNYLCSLLIGCLCCTFVSCKKYLDAKPDQSITTPSNIADLQAILNNYNFINGNYPSASEVSSDDFYLTGTSWAGMLQFQRAFYTWQKYDIVGGDYTAPYSSIEYANVIIDALKQISDGDQNSRNMILGNALFIRGSYHYALSQLFASSYNKTTAGSDLGIALRLTSDIAVKPVRSTVEQTYTAIISDIKQAIPLLPSSPSFKYQASKPAAYGMLARVFLSMSDYKNAGLYADSALNIYSTLIDYNTVNASATIPFAQFNDEVIYDARSSAPQALDQSIAKIDTSLYASYVNSDLRKTVFFKKNVDGSMAFKGNYTGQRFAYLFTGIATDELYFIKAETAVRNGDIAIALKYLNTLLLNRWKSGTYVPPSTNDPKQLLDLILQERRKELLFRSLRWTDLRRLNKESDFSHTLTRNLNGTIYKLEPGSLRFVFQIDQAAVKLSGLTQNP